ncbi:AI-2E family transporter [Roseivirga sp. E12]|uniref:AI-2E family transporter n=1 Tax=Roseivirga sp. E12 TaxID=2819237 RepID=UPI001ABC85A2|nr:AI-2E family transporter [Roseivirga sp. E12]MBO3697230.1 AI-2E family transporter [Roseivirga sp. E12]
MKKLAYSVIAIAGVLALLIYAESILIPLVFGVILWYLGTSLKSLTTKIPVIGKKLNTTMVNVIVFIILVVGFAGLSKLITSSIDSLMLSYESYKVNINSLLDQVNESFNINIQEQFNTAQDGFDYGDILGSIAGSISGILGDAIIILVYAAFMFSEETSFKNKLTKMFNTPDEESRATKIMNKIGNSFGDYIRLKTYVSLLTGVVGYIFLAIMGVDSPFFWALLMFLLNYIPTIGSLVATVFPAVFSLMQFGEFGPFFIILVGLGLIEWVIGNVVEPKIMGNSLNLSPLVTILALIVWGQIWGITGMLLSTPITVVMVIIFSQFAQTRRVAIILSQNGDIQQD